MEKKTVTIIAASVVIALLLGVVFLFIDPLGWRSEGSETVDYEEDITPTVNTEDYEDSEEEIEETDESMLDLPFDMDEIPEVTFDFSDIGEGQEFVSGDDNEDFENREYDKAPFFQQPKIEVDEHYGLVIEKPPAKVQVPKTRRGIQIVGHDVPEDPTPLLEKYERDLALSVRVSFLPSLEDGFTSDPQKAFIDDFPNPFYTIVTKEDLTLFLALELESRITGDLKPKDFMADGTITNLSVEPVGSASEATFRVRFDVLYSGEGRYKINSDAFLVSATKEGGIQCIDRQS